MLEGHFLAIQAPAQIAVGSVGVKEGDGIHLSLGGCFKNPIILKGKIDTEFLAKAFLP